MSVLAPARASGDVIRVDLITQSSALRIALRRALASSGGRAALSSGVVPGADPNSDVRSALVLDADMPGLSGTALLERIAHTTPQTPIVVVGPDSARGRSIRDRSLSAGATAAFVRPVDEQPLALKPLAQSILKAIVDAPARRKAKPDPERPSHEPAHTTPRRRPTRIRPQVLVVASSTGGPQALLALFGGFSPERIGVPVLIVQHMPAAFTPILAEHITRATDWSAKEAVPGEPLVAGEIRIAPGGYHVVIEGKGMNRKLALTDAAPVNFCRPSADVLFVSAAEHFGAGVLALVLTGMGQDGADGARAIKAAGGRVIVQDEATSVVWGMPGATVAAGVADQILPLPEIAPTLSRSIAGIDAC